LGRKLAKSRYSPNPPISSTFFLAAIATGDATASADDKKQRRDSEQHEQDFPIGELIITISPFSKPQSGCGKFGTAIFSRKHAICQFRSRWLRALFLPSIAFTDRDGRESATAVFMITTTRREPRPPVYEIDRASNQKTFRIRPHPVFPHPTALRAFPGRLSWP